MRRVLSLALIHGLALASVPAGAEAERATEATLAAVHLGVEVLEPSPRPARAGDRLGRGDRVRTPSGGAAEVTCDGRLRLELGGASELALGACAAGGPRRGPVATLARGSLLVDYAGRGAVVVATPAGQVKVGQVAQIVVDERGSTRVMVHRGRVRLTGHRRTVRLRAEQGSRVEPGGKPKAARKLPPAPRWTSPPPRLILGGTATFELTASFGSTAKRGRLPHRWRVQVARDERFRDLVVDELVAGTETRLVARRLGPGPHFARVIAVDKDGWEGPPGPAAAVTAASARVSPGVRARLDVVPPGLYCGLDGAPLARVTGPLAVDAHVEHVLRCSTEAGGQGAADLVLAMGKLVDPAAPPVRLKPVQLHARLEAMETGARRAEVVIAVTDAWGAPRAPVRLAATASSGAALTPLVPEGEGRHRAHLRWSPEARSVTLRVEAAEAGAVQVHEVVLRLPAPPPATAPSAPAGPAPVALPTYGVSLGLVGGLLVELPGSRLGGVGLAEARAWARLGRGSLTGGLRIGYERYRVGGIAAQPAGATCLVLGDSSTGTLAAQHIVELSFPITYRFLGNESRVNPYVGILPQVLLEYDRVNDAGRRLKVEKSEFALAGIAGLEILVARRVALFVEAGYRRAVLECSQAGYTLHGVLVLGGLRLGL